MLIKNSKWLPHDSHKTKVVLLSHWLTLSKFQDGKTKVTSRKGGKGMTQVLRTRVAAHKGEEKKRPSSPIYPPSPAQKAPPEAGEIMRRIAEAEQLEGMGRSLSSSLI